MGEPWFDTFEVFFRTHFSVSAELNAWTSGWLRICGKKSKRMQRCVPHHENGKTVANDNNGGINGGITNGMPVVFSGAVKPTPSIAKEQKTVDFIKGENADITIHGRHDPAIVRRICPVIDSVAALAAGGYACAKILERTFF